MVVDQPIVRSKRFFQRVQRTGTDIAEHHADGTDDQRKPGGVPLCMAVLFGTGLCGSHSDTYSRLSTQRRLQCFTDDGGGIVARACRFFRHALGIGRFVAQRL